METVEHVRDGGVDVYRIPASAGQHEYMSLRDRVRAEAVQGGDARVLLDCRALRDPPSIAFGVFCGITRDARRAGGGCVLVHVSEVMQSIMDRTHIAEQVTVAATVADGMAVLLTADPQTPDA